jgi:hypothetical protein
MTPSLKVKTHIENDQCRHMAIFRREADYTIMIVLTVGEGEGNESTRIRALLKDVPRGTTWQAIRDNPKLSKCWNNLRIDIENFMVSISLFLVKTMIEH